MRRVVITTALLATLGLSAPASASDAATALIQDNCTRCHGSEVYTRADRRVTSREGLTKQVRRCELMLGLKWFDEDIDKVADHLNNEYYKF